MRETKSNRSLIQNTAKTNALKCFVCGPDEHCDSHYQEQTVNCGINNPTRYNYQCVKYLIGKNYVDVEQS